VDVIDCRNANVSTDFHERYVHQHYKHSKMARRKCAFHTEEAGFRCVGVLALGGASRADEALCKGCDGVAAFDISQ
jgi:hypothetical protein